MAIVNGAPVTLAAYDESGLVFTAPDGGRRATDDQILEAVIAQSLVHEELVRIGIEISEEDVASHVAALLDRTPQRGGVERSGGIAGLRHRMRSFLEFRALKARITQDVHISEQQVIDAYAANPILHTAPYVEVAPIIRQRLHHDAVEEAWADWLAAQRRCATVVFIGSAMPSLSARPATGCT